MQNVWSYVRGHGRILLIYLVIVLLLAWLFLFKLGSLSGGLSSGEVQTANVTLGWHGIYHHPLNLPLEIVRSVFFKYFKVHSIFLIRLPNVIFGLLALVSFSSLVWLWHGFRTAILATLLFMFSAWTLHVSRLASFDVLYLWAMPTLVLVQLKLMQTYKNPYVWYGSLLLWGLMLYIPGLVWLILLSVWWQRQALADGWRHFQPWWQRILSVLAVLIWLPLLIIDLTRAGQLRQWLGLPSHFASVPTIAKDLAAVPYHLLIRGPLYPNLWLGKEPILDGFCLFVCFIGIYFYVTNWQSKRSRLLLEFFIIGVILIGLQGPVGLTFLVPVLYMVIATGLAFLIHEWLRVFPNNPLARSFGIGLVSLAVLVSCIYNYRSYFIAWPHNSVTISTFHYHKP